MLRSSLCSYSNAYRLFKKPITFPNTGTAAAPNNGKKVIFKNCAPFTYCISGINNTEIDHHKDINVVMSMCNLIEYSDNYLETFGSSWQYYRNELAINNKGIIIDFLDDPDNALFK